MTDREEIPCDHTEGVKKGYILNCTFCGWINPDFKGGFVYRTLERNQGSGDKDD